MNVANIAVIYTNWATNERTHTKFDAFKQQYSSMYVCTSSRRPDSPYPIPAFSAS